MGASAESSRLLGAKFEALFPHLNERQRRLVIGAEARAMGHGGIRIVAKAAGVSEATVSRGAGELDSGIAPLDQARQPGGGRKRVADLDPGLRPALLALVEPQERGDPMSPLRWTTKSLRHLAHELTRQGHRVGRDTVAALLRQEGFSLQGNSRMLEGAQHPDRNGQFCYISALVQAHLEAGEPVVSVDAKKKEQVGDFHQAGVEWRPAGEPVLVRSHDIPVRTLGQVIPYGVYDLARNAGWVNVGTDHDTAAFAVESLRRWWNARGRLDYPNATRLLVTADAGGSNSYRIRAWKVQLAALAREIGIFITVCHFPPGTSKWNKIEHRLFSHISMSWRGRPLTSHEVVMETIAATTTRKGLTVHAELDAGSYPTGIIYAKEEVQALALAQHHWHGEWNYTFKPHAPQPTTTEVDVPRPDHLALPERAPAWLSHPSLTGLEADEWTALLAAFEQQVRDRPAVTMRHKGPAASAGQRRLSSADHLLATVLNQRWRTHINALAALLGVSKGSIGRALHETSYDLQQLGHVITPAPIKATTAADLARIIGREVSTP